MNKTELLADLDANGLRVIEVTEQTDPVKNAADVRSYIANVMEQNGNRVTARNVGFYVFDEGQAGEKAYYRDELKPKNAAYDVMQSYIAGLVPGTYIRAEITSVDEPDRYGWAQAWKSNGDGTCTEVKLLVYKDGQNPIAHYELT